jgi:hypothetical protein
MTLCLQVSPSRLGHQITVFEYLQANETALAMELIIAGAERDLSSQEQVLVAKHLDGVYADVWAVPGASEAWVAERCARRRAQPGGS